MSPIKLDTEAASQTETIIDAIWPGNPLLCCGKNTYTFATRHREVWRGRLSGCSFIVPNPMLRGACAVPIFGMGGLVRASLNFAAAGGGSNHHSK
jgi:hypothetical protein